MSGIFSFCKDLFSSTKKRTFSSRDESTESDDTEEDRSNNKKQCIESNETEEDENRSTDSEVDSFFAEYQRIRGYSYETSSVAKLLDDAIRSRNRKDIMFYTDVLRQQNEISYQHSNSYTNILRQQNEIKYQNTNSYCNAVTYRYIGKVAAPNAPVVEEVEDDLIFNEPVQDVPENEPVQENAPSIEKETTTSVNRRSSRLLPQPEIAPCTEDSVNRRSSGRRNFTRRNSNAPELSPEELNKMGKSYENGTQYLKEDKSKAFEFYSKCAELGNTDALYAVGRCYKFGIGVIKNFKKAVEYYTKAADQGHKDAQYHLGNRYFYGEGVTKSYERAVEYYTKAAEQGHRYAQYHLGNRYFYGNKGVSKSYERAVEYYTKAADQGHKDAKAKLQSIRATQSSASTQSLQDTPVLEKAPVQEEDLVTPLPHAHVEKNAPVDENEEAPVQEDPPSRPTLHAPVEDNEQNKPEVYISELETILL